MARSAGWGLHNDIENLPHDSIHRLIDVGVPEPQDAKSRRFKMRIAALFARKSSGLAVLRTIDFNDEAMAKVGKVEDEAINRRLTAEMITLAVESAEFTPQADFLRCH